mmetsp:Transcript_24923/g.41548  ORF Transcript_24923/g.41548 Transcript_24923/m.41548 type:complete len:526 (+) Transcript_24923:111-1688(+)|eukprot:CAMPEP_0174983398 /NCGR_PEP_ID=MMETSP0004_2-20121128/17106_1 /TAXON_ID=420556 /ORGANISM="Ochromonas sp., Strain CCMP1393" /LENGTH=525 /DNA_ID=CAMNT_0016235615 /DNA_START=28 /DNA_END=1605 /DNA_ORIENTATION=+
MGSVHKDRTAFLDSFVKDFGHRNDDVSRAIGQMVDSNPTLNGDFQSTEDGDTIFHLILASVLEDDVKVQYLRMLVTIWPDGVKLMNDSGHLPLHFCLAKTSLHLNASIIQILLDAYVEAAQIPDKTQGLIPLFHCVARHDLTLEVCQLICEAYPQGVKAFRNSNFALHELLKLNSSPDVAVVRYLVESFPGALEHTNNLGLLPVHIACASTDDLEIIQLLLEANPKMIQVPDRQGRTCLHIAVLRIAKQEEERRAEARRQQRDRKRQEQEEEAEEEKQRIELVEANRVGTDSPNNRLRTALDRRNSDDSVEFEAYMASYNPSGSTKPENRLINPQNRSIVRYLIQIWPAALQVKNNFLSIPVDLVLAKRTKNSAQKVVTVYGQYYDPLTARVLLRAAERHFASSRRDDEAMSNPLLLSAPVSAPVSVPVPVVHGVVASTSNAAKYAHSLRKFNWMARKAALFASYQGDTYIRCATLSDTANQADEATPTTSASVRTAEVIPSHNYLARLRQMGLVELTRTIIEYL